MTSYLLRLSIQTMHLLALLHKALLTNLKSCQVDNQPIYNLLIQKKSPLEKFSFYTQLPATEVWFYNQKKLRQAYHRAALSMHPDKVEASNRLAATIAFQDFVNVYEVLQNKSPMDLK